MQGQPSRACTDPPPPPPPTADTLHANLREVQDLFEVKRFALFDQVGAWGAGATRCHASPRLRGNVSQLPQRFPPGCNPDCSSVVG